MKMKKAKKALAFLLASVLAFGSVPATAMAETGTKPEDGTTVGQPFPSGTGGSQNFRIPGLVTLDDGTLVAACDARWNHGGDACGLDTIVSRSTDNGENWSYTFANYLGDNGNKYAAYSTAFIDPAIATDGETVYMIADVWPGGYALNTAPLQPPVGENGFDENGNLRLSNDKRKTYSYYLRKSDSDDSYYEIVENATDAVVEGYAVDAYFNITGDEYTGNLFYSDSPYLVYPTDYLYLTTSADGGATWSIPSLLNLKREDEQTLLVGPGRGIVTSTGRLVFTAYEWTRSKGGDVKSACFYSDDKGLTWERGESVSELSSEAAVVEADGKLYMFTRHGGYYVSSDWGATWSERKDPGISYNQGCQLSAITYSKKIDGKTAIILSAPSNTGSRAAGKLFVGLVQADGTLSWDYSYSVNGSAYYAYSCMTELNDGSLGLLYENEGTAITYTNLPLSQVAEGAVVSNLWCEDADGNAKSVLDMKSQTSVTLKVCGAAEGAALQVSSSDEKLLTAKLEGNSLTVTSGAAAEGLSRGTVTLTDGTETLKLTVNVTDAQKYEIAELRMGDKITCAVSGDVNTGSLDTAIAKVTEAEGEMTIEGIAEGTTSVKVGDTEYFIIVKNDVKELKLKEGESIVVKGSVIQKPADEKIVSVAKNEDKPPYAKTEGITEDGLYLIGSASSIVISDDSTASDPVGRAMKAANFEKEDLTEYMWTINALGDGYTIQSQDGRYLNFEDSTANSCGVTLSSSPQTLRIVNGSSDGYGITNGTHYLNNFGGKNVQAAGWNENDNNWYFYQTADSYVITGLTEGRTEFAVSGTTYQITVGDPKPVEVEEALTELSQKIAAAEAALKQSASYTDASVKALTDAVKAAKELMVNEEAQTISSVRAAIDSLTQAISKLTLKPEDKADQPVVPVQPKPELPKVGSIQPYKKASYKVLSSTEKGGTVAYVKPDKKTNKKIVVPASIKIGNLTYKVTEIAASALKANTKLTQVTIGANVTKIGKSAFAGSKNLKKITIQSKGLKSVGKQAIKNVNKKCVIKVPKKKLAAYKKLFKGKGLKSTMKIK